MMRPRKPKTDFWVHSNPKTPSQLSISGNPYGAVLTLTVHTQDSVCKIEHQLNRADIRNMDGFLVKLLSKAPGFENLRELKKVDYNELLKQMEALDGQEDSNCSDEQESA